jgi:hypothetical protein
VSTPNYDYYYFCSELSNKKMIPILTNVKARSIEEFGEMLSHSGEEFIFVVRGAIYAYTQYYEPLYLEAGEGVYIDSTMPHAYICASKEIAQVLGICSSPEIALRAMQGVTSSRRPKVAAP